MEMCSDLAFFAQYVRKQERGLCKCFCLILIPVFCHCGFKVTSDPLIKFVFAKVYPVAQDDKQLCESQPTRMMTCTQTGTEIKPPAMYS